MECSLERYVKEGTGCLHHPCGSDSAVALMTLAVSGGRKPARLLEHFRQMALVAESGVECYFRYAQVCFFEKAAGGVESLLEDVLPGTDADYSHEQALKMRYRHAIFLRQLL